MFLSRSLTLPWDKNSKPIPGRCSRWGCMLPVGKSSTYGPGPVCLVCATGLRPSPPRRRRTNDARTETHKS